MPKCSKPKKAAASSTNPLGAKPKSNARGSKEAAEAPEAGPSKLRATETPVAPELPAGYSDLVVPYVSAAQGYLIVAGRYHERARATNHWLRVFPDGTFSFVRHPRPVQNLGESVVSRIIATLVQQSEPEMFSARLLMSAVIVGIESVNDETLNEFQKRTEWERRLVKFAAIDRSTLEYRIRSNLNKIRMESTPYLTEIRTFKVLDGIKRMCFRLGLGEGSAIVTEIKEDFDYYIKNHYERLSVQSTKMVFEHFLNLCEARRGQPIPA